MAYGWQYEITVFCTDGETIHIDGVDVDFSCVRDDEKEPNEADLTIWGLTPETHNAIVQAGSMVTFAGGYIDEGMFTLFQGELISAVNVKPGEVYGLKMKLYEALIPFRPVNATWSLQYQSIAVTAGDSIFDGAAEFSPDSGLLGVPLLKIHTPKRKKKKPSEKEQIQAKHEKSIKTYAWPPKNSQVDYSKGARRQIGVIEAITWESLLRGGVEIGEKVVLSSPSMGENWVIIVKKISHRFSTRDSQPRTTSWEGIIA